MRSQAYVRLGVVIAAVLSSTIATADEETGPGLHMGVRVGEVTQESAILWTRLCAAPRKADGPDSPTPTPNSGRIRRGETTPVSDVDLSQLNGYLPGMAGRVVFRVEPEGEAAFETSAQFVDAENDYIAKAVVGGLKPNARYRVVAKATVGDGEPMTATSEFHTAASADVSTGVRFAVLTGQEYRDRDAGAEGFLAYDAMSKDKLDFLVYTGDSVYYDRPEFYARSEDQMRHFWHRMFSLPKAVHFFKSTPTYFEVDDHDILDNDCWPGSTSVLAPMTMDDGLRILREQTPIGDRPYRSVRWGKDVEVWLLEGRLYRSPNQEPDGPEKTIWGATQREWLKQSLAKSNATYRVVVSPTPVVGPDRSKGKNDNHANPGFETEGKWFKSLLAEPEMKNTIICCGDRHWQYHSVDPDFGVHEFSCGPFSDQHAGGAPKEQPDWQVFRRVKGGYLTVQVQQIDGGERPHLIVQHRSVNGDVVYEWKASGDE